MPQSRSSRSTAACSTPGIAVADCFDPTPGPRTAQQPNVPIVIPKQTRQEEEQPMGRPERHMREYALMMSQLTCAIADALRDGVTAESIVAALNNLVTLLEEE